ncbi:DUF4411 family protein [Nannocystis pusilla]|uniref:DUF4411 family protein n=1 Tax=Nannocystis pusilla TaxID=889268 RepID=UPI003B838BD1
MSARFLLDANIFIAAKNKYYSFDLCPGFWDALADGHARERVYSIDRVHDELRRGDDDLVEWVKTLPDTFFVPCGDAASQYAALQQRVASSESIYAGR